MNKKKVRLQVPRHSLGYYIDRLETNQPFAISRYGDGEWKTILYGHPGGEPDGHNSNGCTFTKQLSNELKRVLRYQFELPFEYGLLRIANRTLGEEIEQFMEWTNSDIQLQFGDLLLEKSLIGRLFPFMKTMRGKRVLYVGPPHCRRLGELGFFELMDYVDIPKHNASDDKLRIVSEILQKIEEHDIEVVGFSAGLHAKVFIGDLWLLTEEKVTLIDFGSMFDGYFEIGSRSYIRRGLVDWKGLLEVNTGKRKFKKDESFRFKEPRKA